MGWLNPALQLYGGVTELERCFKGRHFTLDGHLVGSLGLLVRNKLPDVRCSECGAAAQWLSVPCVVEEDVMNFLCQQHTRTHGHEDYG